jgi:hypothetical protein
MTYEILLSELFKNYKNEWTYSFLENIRIGQNFDKHLKEEKEKIKKLKHKLAKKNNIVLIPGEMVPDIIHFDTEYLDVSRNFKNLFKNYQEHNEDLLKKHKKEYKKFRKSCMEKGFLHTSIEIDYTGEKQEFKKGE